MQIATRCAERLQATTQTPRRTISLSMESRPNGSAAPEAPENPADFRWHQRFSVRVAIGAGASVGLAVLAAMIVSGLVMQRTLLNSEREHVRSTAILLAAGVQAPVAQGD